LTSEVFFGILDLPPFRLSPVEASLVLWRVLDRESFSLTAEFDSEDESLVSRVGFYYSAKREEVSVVATTKPTEIQPLRIIYRERVSFLGEEVASLQEALSYVTE
jgi:hypothetical protein